jgi:hypothetical protein
MFRVFCLLITASIGAVGGLGSVWLALTDPRFDVAAHRGEWRVATAASDPYAAARAARAGTLSLGAAEGIALVARSDEAGRALDPRCHYAVDGPVPAADLWTLVVTDEAGRLPSNPACRVGFTSRDSIRRGDGTVEIVVGPTARPGNFVPATGLRQIVLTLRVYSSAIAADLPAAEQLPRVRRLQCPGALRP